MLNLLRWMMLTVALSSVTAACHKVTCQDFYDEANQCITKLRSSGTVSGPFGTAILQGLENLLADPNQFLGTCKQASDDKSCDAFVQAITNCFSGSDCVNEQALVACANGSFTQGSCPAARQIQQQLYSAASNPNG